jgi:hypothetical protein
MGSKHPKKRPRPRKPRTRYPKRIVVTLPQGVAERLELARGKSETRLDLIREGIERLLLERGIND